MVGFRITRERLEAWIRALGILYYEHYGKMEDSYLVDWYDEPTEWLDEGNKSICIGLLKETQLLYKVTLFVTTGVIQAQGLQHNLFTCNDFPMLLILVNAICDHEISTGTMNCEVADDKAEDTDDSDETLLKTPIEATPNDQVEKQSPSDNTETPKVTFKDLENLQTIFVDSLSKITETQASIVSKVEKNLTDSLEKVTTTVNKLQTQFNTMKSLKYRQTNDTNPDKLQSRIADLERQLYQTRTDKYNLTVEIARLESLLKAEKARNNTIGETLSRELKTLKHENEHLSGKLDTRSEENDQLMNENDHSEKKWMTSSMKFCP